MRVFTFLCVFILVGILTSVYYHLDVFSPDLQRPAASVLQSPAPPHLICSAPPHLIRSAPQRMIPWGANKACIMMPRAAGNR